ncbi:MAG: DUF2617 family protein [Planctomycetaceae bacterium]|nr:DUF2617 family protein [Planctomycetaceae bacterium]
MHVHVARPAARQLTFHIYSRVLHPELFDTCASTVLFNDDNSLTLRICESGHVVELQRDRDLVSEIKIDGQQELPSRGRCLSVGLKKNHDITSEPHPGIAIQASTQIEFVEAEVFERLTDEFRADFGRATLSHLFGSRNRLRPDAVSLLFAECCPHSLVVHAFHTYPDDLAIIRTQSLYEF